MEITEVRIKLMEEPGERLKAFCSITFDDCFVIRDLKIIDGTSGPFVAMPSRKLTSHCSQCGMKNHLRANYCNQCGKRQDEGRLIKDADGRAKLYADIAHPINSDCRELIQRRVLEEFDLEKVRAQQPGYICTYDDYGEERYATLKDAYDDFDFEEPPVERRTTVTYTNGSDVRHRIEPAEERPGAPHHGIAANGARQTAAARHERDDDAFGAGL